MRKQMMVASRQQPILGKQRKEQWCHRHPLAEGRSAGVYNQGKALSHLVAIRRYLPIARDCNIPKCIFQ